MNPDWKENFLSELEASMAEIEQASKAIVAHNKYLHAHRYDYNKDALRALGRID